MNTKHTSGNWKVVKIGEAWKVKEWAAVANIQYGGGDSGFTILAPVDTQTLLHMEAEENAKLIAAAPELLQMVYSLKNCIKRLTSDDTLTQYDKDTEAQWEGEAHELLSRINPNYYKNANQ